MTSSVIFCIHIAIQTTYTRRERRITYTLHILTDDPTITPRCLCSVSFCVFKKIKSDVTVTVSNEAKNCTGQRNEIGFLFIHLNVGFLIILLWGSNSKQKAQNSNAAVEASPPFYGEANTITMKYEHLLHFHSSLVFICSQFSQIEQ